MFTYYYYIFDLCFIGLIEHLLTFLGVYSTLSTCPFGAFPALPTLDAHYCSHIHMLCREAMIASLLRSAAELEQFARESELSCANLILLLRPTFELYDLLPPALPAPIPLTAYPLDFRAPERKSCHSIL